MFQLFRSDAGKRLIVLIPSKRFSTYTNEIKEYEPETNYVKLIGTAWDSSSLLPSGGLSCKVVQRCKNENGQQFSISHMINIPPKVQKICGISALSRGQKFNINGYIRSIPFKTSMGKTRQAIAIIPHDIDVCESGEEVPQDVCIVMMTAIIESKIFNHGNIVTFHLRTHVPLRDGETGFTGETTEHSHSIIASNPDLKRYIQTHLNQYDKVFIEGYLNYQKTQTEKSQRMSGNIIPVRIEKIE